MERLEVARLVHLCKLFLPMCISRSTQDTRQHPQKVDVEPAHRDFNFFFTLSPVISGQGDFKRLLFSSLSFFGFPSISTLGVHSFYNQEKHYFKKDVFKLSFALSRSSTHPPASWLNKLISGETAVLRCKGSPPTGFLPGLLHGPPLPPPEMHTVQVHWCLSLTPPPWGARARALLTA